MSVTLDDVAQVGLAVLSIAAILLVAKKNKWGFVVGLLSEPFWFITSYLNKQWGIFILTCVYTVTWAYGAYEWFYKDDKQKEPAK